MDKQGVQAVAGCPYDPGSGIFQECVMPEDQAAAGEGRALDLAAGRQVEARAGGESLTGWSGRDPAEPQRFEEAVRGVEQPARAVAVQVDALGEGRPGETFRIQGLVREADERTGPVRAG